MTDSRYASRKFVLACSGFIAALALLAVGLISSEQWVSFNTWLLGLYLAANVGDQAVTKKD